MKPADPHRNWDGPPIGLFWDQSLVWGIICWNTLDQLAIPVHLLSSEDIIRGRLQHYRVLLVPGGWASHKVRCLGTAGSKELRRFVHAGGCYFGFCGGAGLALTGPHGLGLVPVKRLPFNKRLPNISGQVFIKAAKDHPAWCDLPSILPVSIWWPSQFQWEDQPQQWRVANYEKPAEGLWVADLPLKDLDQAHTHWEKWEAIYGINLNPARLSGEPAIVEIPQGRGRLLLSYPHLETPDDQWGNRLFRNFLFYLSDSSKSRGNPEAPAGFPNHQEMSRHPPCEQALEHLLAARRSANSLIDFGKNHLLWDWRTPWLLHWRRGLRGLEYGTLAVSLSFLCEQLHPLANTKHGHSCPWLGPAKQAASAVRLFCRRAKRLLLEEKVATQSGALAKTGSVNPSVDGLRAELFGTQMNHGGACQSILDQIDRLLFHAIRLKQSLSPLSTS